MVLILLGLCCEYTCTCIKSLSCILHVCTCIHSQVERTSSEKAISATVAEEREKYDKLIADMKVKMHNSVYMYICIVQHTQL